ncbi:Hypothetical protein NGAL_HAMBI2605_20380 [Neorhizobium galegae bv. orientalis]|nr:Hypothetical protein NGAL_HAMBI2605_20380 [Neorhizobium galegae bv. orientalis]
MLTNSSLERSVAASTSERVSFFSARDLLMLLRLNVGSLIEIIRLPSAGSPTKKSTVELLRPRN